eukprot:scaffold15704_cov92-Cyclotella_meneghiniana.AAC.2
MSRESVELDDDHLMNETSRDREDKVHPDEFIINPPISDKDLHVIYSCVCNMRKINGQDFAQRNIDAIMSNEAFNKHHKTIKSGESSSVGDCLGKLKRYSLYDLSGYIEFRMLTIPDKNHLWESVNLTLQLIESEGQFGECRILPFARAKEIGIGRMRKMFVRNPNYDEQTYYAGEMDARTRLDSFGSAYDTPKYSGISKLYLLNRPFEQDDLDFANSVTPDYLVKVLKVGSSYRSNNSRMNLSRYSLRVPRMELSLARVYNAAYYEEKVKDEFDIHRKAFALGDSNGVMIGEWMIDNDWCNRKRVEEFVMECWKEKPGKSVEEKATPPKFEYMIWEEKMRKVTPSLLLLFMYKVICIVNRSELDIILHKVEFKDENEKDLWDDKTFLEASIGDQLRRIHIGDTNIEKQIKEEMRTRFNFTHEKLA